MTRGLETVCAQVVLVLVNASVHARHLKNQAHLVGKYSSRELPNFRSSLQIANVGIAMLPWVDTLTPPRALYYLLVVCQHTRAAQ